MEVERKEFASRVLTGMALVDIGCGPGHDTDFWSKHGLKTVGVDECDEMVRLAREKYPNRQFEVRSAMALDSLNMKFDCAWMSYMFLHLPRALAPRVLQVVHSCLRPRAPLFLCTSLAEITEEVIAAPSGLRDESGHDVVVPQIRWSINDLLDMFSPLFVPEWSQISHPIPGKSERKVYSGILRRIDA